MNKNEIIEKFESSCLIMYNSLSEGDYKKHNKEYDRLKKIYDIFSNDLKFASECLNILLRHDNITVRNYSAAFCLSLNINKDNAISVLKKNSINKNEGINSFNAEMTLKTYNKQGYLDLYK